MALSLAFNNVARNGLFAFYDNALLNSFLKKIKSVKN